MPPKPQKQTGAGHIDLTKVLLPKKEGTPSVDSAQRINAGVLFEQEQNATLPEAPKPEAAAPAPKENSIVKPLQTYQGDIESVVGEQHISVVSIAAAEANRRGKSKLEDSATPSEERGPWLRKTIVSAAGVLLLVVAGGTALYIYARLQPVPVAQQFPSPFIVVDETQPVEIAQSDARPKVMQVLTAARNDLAISVGLVARILIIKPTALGGQQEVSAPELLQTLAPNIPPELVRTLLPQMLLGVHSYDENQPFLILKADSYDVAYRGMIDWERTMQSDLGSLFAQKPEAPARVEQAPVTPIAAATTSTSTAGTATSTVSGATTTPVVVAAVPVQVLLGSFVDKVVENRDARVLLGAKGQVILLWTMLDRSTIVIATNGATLGEVISRLSEANILTLPN